MNVFELTRALVDIESITDNEEQIGDVLFARRALQHRHQFPAVLTPLVEDLFRRVRQQRDGGVFPTCRFAHEAEPIGQRFGARAREERKP